MEGVGERGRSVARIGGRRLAAALALSALAACSSGGSDGSAGPVLSAAAGDGQVSYSWSTVPGASAYHLHWSTDASQVMDDQVASDATSPHVVSGLANGVPVHAVLEAVVGGDSVTSAQVSTTPSPAQSTSPPHAPGNLAAAPADGAVTLTWNASVGATSYTLYHATMPGVTPANGTPIAGVTSPYAHTGLANGTIHHYVLTASNAGGESAPSSEVSATPSAAAGPPAQSLYDPPWATATPLDVIQLFHDGGLTDEQNGAALVAAVASLQPGDRLEVGSGTWSVNQLWNVDVQGTAANPIWIVAAPGAEPHVTRPDASQNVINFGILSSGQQARYVCFRGFEVSGGSQGIKIYSVSNLWIDRCEIHHTGDTAVAANSEVTDHIHLTRNEIHHTSGTGEGVYLGGNFSTNVTSQSVVALNHVHDCGGFQGDGIELKQGSWGCWIAENLVHDTNYPCIIAYGTDGNPQNVIERNVCYGSGDNVMQVQGEAIVRNNLIVDGATGFHSHDHQGSTTNLQVTHNTIVNTGKATNLSSWNNRANMVFANNVVYSMNGTSIDFSNGSTNVTVSGNVVVGNTVKIVTGFVQGNGIADFVDGAWDASALDFYPAAASPIIGSGDAAFFPLIDLTGKLRVLPLEAGAFDGQ